jgi:plasmid stabilization system protein ParE
MTIEYHPEARLDFARAFHWYLKKSPQAASNFLVRTEETAGQILASPNIFPSTSLGCRKATIKRYPISLIFQVREGSINIVAVAHAKRRESFWHNRVTTE